MIVALLVVLSLSPGSYQVEPQLTKDAAIAKAEAILKSFQEGRTADIVKEFDAKMTQALPEAKVKPVWPGLVSRFGDFKSVDDRREGLIQGRQAVELILVFEKETIVQRAIFDTDGKIGGLIFRPLSSAILSSSR